MNAPVVIGRTARLLGYAGLLPAMLGVAAILLGRRGPPGASSDVAIVAGYWLTTSYAALILSFLGGVWWGFAMRREEKQGRAAALAVMPSLFALELLALAFVKSTAGDPPVSAWAAVALGSTILLTLPVDRHFERTGEAPPGWLDLRLPLSIGLGSLTIAAGILVGVP